MPGHRALGPLLISPIPVAISHRLELGFAVRIGGRGVT